MAKNFQTTQGSGRFCHVRSPLDLGCDRSRVPPSALTARLVRPRPRVLASASANAEGLSTSMTSTMREGNQRAGHLASYDASKPADARASRVVPTVLHSHSAHPHGEDAAKMVHVGGAEARITAAAESLVDYNRCGTR